MGLRWFDISNFYGKVESVSEKVSNGLAGGLARIACSATGSREVGCREWLQGG